MLQRNIRRLAAAPQEGSDMHIVAAFEVGGNSVLVMTACGKLITPSLLCDLPLQQIGCTRCRSVSKQYNHNVGYLMNGGQR